MDADSELLMTLISIDGVEHAELHWSPGLEVRAHLAAMDWGVRERVIAAVRQYVDSLDYLQAAAVRLSFPEPIDFTEAVVEKSAVG